MIEGSALVPTASTGGPLLTVTDLEKHFPVRKGILWDRTVGHVNAHGTSTPANDSTETAAVKLALGEDVATEPVPRSSWDHVQVSVGHILSRGDTVGQ